MGGRDGWEVGVGIELSRILRVGWQGGVRRRVQVEVWTGRSSALQSGGTEAAESVRSFEK